MNKDYKSYYDEWLNHENAWNGYSAKEIFSELKASYELADQASSAISSSGLTGISSARINISNSKIPELEALREKLVFFCKKIHLDGEDIIDDVFNYGVMKALADIYALNPSDMKCNSMGAEYQLKSIMETVITDPALKADFSKKAGNLDKDKLTDSLKAGLLSAIGRYYDGKVSPYMRKTSGYDISNFNEDRDLIIEYYEYLNPADAKNMNHFLKALAKDGDKRYLEDIKNIKYMAYTAKEPYRSVFFKYVKELKIGNYDYHGKDSKGNENAQYYDSGSKKLYIRLHETNPNGVSDEGRDDPRGAYVTFFHEVGHAIDDLSQKDNKFLFFTTKVKNTSVDGAGVTVFESAENDVKENIKNSVNEYVEKKGYRLSNTNRNAVVKALMTPNFSGFPANSTEKKVYDAIISAYTADFTANVTESTVYNGISDIYGGYTDNKLKGTYGHPDYYWIDSGGKFDGSQGEELFAHIFARYMASNDEVIEVMKEYFPSTISNMEKFMNAQKGK